MNIEANEEDLDERSTLKVNLPKRLKVRMQSLKVLTGQTLSSQVEEAVKAYLDGRERSLEREEDGDADT